MTNRKNENNTDCPDRNYEDEKSQVPINRKAPNYDNYDNDFWKCIVNPHPYGC